MSKTTRATQALSKAGVSFALHTYDYDSDAASIGLQAAAALGADPKRVPAAIAAAALDQASVFINGGQRGLQIELAPRDAVRVLGAIVAGIAV